MKDKLHNKFNGPIAISEIFNNYAILLILKAKQKTKANFDCLKPSSEALSNFDIKLLNSTIGIYYHHENGNIILNLFLKTTRKYLTH